jgi:hypothetical protein
MSDPWLMSSLNRGQRAPLAASKVVIARPRPGDPVRQGANDGTLARWSTEDAAKAIAARPRWLSAQNIGRPSAADSPRVLHDPTRVGMGHAFALVLFDLKTLSSKGNHGIRDCLPSR